MKKLLIVGGSNGVGLSLAKLAVENGYFAVIADICEPDPVAGLNETNSEWVPCNLLEFNADLFQQLSGDKDICGLMITAGIGRVSAFEDLHFAEIKKTLDINTVSALEIISIFYKRISGAEKFMCGVMCSIAGLVSSPLFSVYAASKEGNCQQDTQCFTGFPQGYQIQRRRKLNGRA